MSQQTLYKAFYHACCGLGSFFRNDRNGKLHLLAAVAVCIAGIALGLSGIEWCIMLACIAAVLSLEMLNHALEKLCDAIHPGEHTMIKICKDVAAGAVLCWSIISVIIAAIILLPKIPTI